MCAQQISNKVRLGEIKGEERESEQNNNKKHGQKPTTDMIMTIGSNKHKIKSNQAERKRERLSAEHKGKQ